MPRRRQVVFPEPWWAWVTRFLKGGVRIMGRVVACTLLGLLNPISVYNPLISSLRRFRSSKTAAEV